MEASAIAKAMEDPEFQEKAVQLQMPLHFLNAEQYTKFLQEINADLKVQWEKNPW